MHVPDEHVFIDDGFSGSTLVRPGLDGLRDAIAMNSYDRVVVYDPDRLARSYVYQMLLLDEAKWHNCEIEFIRCPIGKSPDEHLLLQMQGVIAEYERAKIAERTRRGKLRLLRFNQRRQEVMVESSRSLTLNKWHHIVAVFTGAEIRLHIDGKLDGMAKVNGLRSDKESAIGSPAIWSTGVRAKSHFAGDIAAVRILQRFMSDAEIAFFNKFYL